MITFLTYRTFAKEISMSITERALAVRRPRFEPSKPDYIVRTQDPNNDRNWLTLGAAWKGETRDGQEVITVRLNTVPIGSWDGKLKLLVPLADGEEDDANAGNVPDEPQPADPPRSRRRREEEVPA